MPYSIPSSPSPSFPSISPSRQSLHRRTRSCSPTFSDESGTGAFSSLGSLPRRKPMAKKSVFRLKDELPEDKLSEDGASESTPPLFLSLPPAYPEGEEGSVPFPSLLSPLSPLHVPESGIRIPRTTSSPIILSNGKPLKPSLKSASSSPQIAVSHLRSQSAPATPPSSKNVHFAESDKDLETVKVFNRSGRPASLSKGGEDTETETEADFQSYFPVFPPSMQPDRFPVIDPSVTSTIPNISSNSYANIYIETMTFPKSRSAALYGSILVRNLDFEKSVALRFTLDDWQTTSEVSCKHVVSLSSLPPPFSRTRTVGDAIGLLASNPSASAQEPTWDRFGFCVHLEYYEHKLPEQTIWFVARFTCPKGEWWDNNDGNNYRVGFKRPALSPSGSVSRSQQKTFTVPPSMKATPVTPKVDVQKSVLPFPTFSPSASPVSGVPPPLSSGTTVTASPFPTSKISTPPPTPPVAIPPRRSAGLAERRGVHVTLSPTLGKMSLTNYAAPSDHQTQTPTPPRSRSGSLEDLEVQNTRPSQTYAQSALPALRDSSPLFSSPRSSPPRVLSQSPPTLIMPGTTQTSEVTSTPSEDVTPSVSSQISALAASGQPSAELHAVLVKQWCFAQSTPPTPGVFDNSRILNSDVSPASEVLIAASKIGGPRNEVAENGSSAGGYSWWLRGGSPDSNRSGVWFNWSGGDVFTSPFRGSASVSRTDVSHKTSVGVES